MEGETLTQEGHIDCLMLADRLGLNSQSKHVP